MRINKFIARSGYTSRKKAEDFVRNGEVKVNGKIVTDLSTKIQDKDFVTVKGKPLSISQTSLYIFHKPRGCLTSRSDNEGRKLIYDYLPESLKKLMPIGRLDFNSEGLLLLTNDGMLKREFELPKNQYKRTYIVRFHGKLTKEIITQIKAGITIEGMHYQVIDLKTKKTSINSWCEISLAEGKNREIRKIFGHFGLEVSRLIRISYGKYNIGELKPGKHVLATI